MARTAVLGTLLGEFAGSDIRKPRAQVLVLDPRRTTMSAVANGSNAEPWMDLSAFVESVKLNWNVGFENGDNASIPSAEIRFVRAPNPGVNLREGFLQDGVIVQVRVGDDRVRMADWEPVFTGHFRGTPGNDPGTRADRSEGMSAVAYGREEGFINLKVKATEAKPAGTDLGEIVQQIARDWMGLTQGEILIGALGVLTLHETNQIVDRTALSALWDCLMPAGKKPMFDGRGRLVAVDFDLDKPAARIYSEGDFPIRSLRKSPNDVEVNNAVLFIGQDHNLTKLPQEFQRLVRDIMPTVGFFEKEFDEVFGFSEDRTQRADDTYLVTKTRIKWSHASYSQRDEFSGRIKIDTKWLRNARAIIFVTWLASQLAVTTIDLLIQSGVNGNTVVINAGVPITLAILRSILNILSQVAMAGLLWAMQFLGRGRYEIHGKPFEYAYQELKSLARLPGLLPEQTRTAEFQNNFISTMDALDRAAVRQLRRELVKNQVYEAEVMDDPLLEVDDVVSNAAGDRFYILTIQRELRRGGPSTMQVTAWKVWDGRVNRLLRTPSIEEVFA
jgi:hypothetical protein